MQRLVALILVCLGLLTPFTASAWWQDEWNYRKQLSIDTTPEGGAITESPGRMPVLVRLHTGNFIFDGVQEKGNDLRFVGADDKTVLNYQVESYDPLLGMALIWVDVPSVEGAQRQDIWMYYGNKNAPSTANGQLIFDPDYTLVYHFDDTAGSSPRDTTAYGNNAQNQPGGITEGIIGRAAQFGGGEPLMLPATQSLAITQGGAFTFSAWVRPDNIDGEQLIYSRRDNGNTLLIGLAHGVAFVEVNGQRSTSNQPVSAGQWQLLSVTAGNTGISLYINGRSVGRLDSALPALASVAAVGGDIPGAVPATSAMGTDASATSETPVDNPEVAGAETSAAPVTPAYQPFVGAIDELRLSKVARSETALLADAVVQGPDSRLMAYGNDEEQSGFGFGGLGFLMKSVPVDAWIVLFILLIMMFQSWYIMITKNRHLSRVVKGNLMFRGQYSSAGAQYDALVEEPALNTMLADSTLWRLYKVAVQEVRNRRVRDGYVHAITPMGIEAIRAAMDSARTVESQRLSTRLSSLSNAIAGGPYIGLLGTVLGIILVFLGTAMAGDVNINAIAPGMAAALVATAMGLFVAIPALFGYNRLITKNREVGADMRMFTDEYITRLAESLEIENLSNSASKPEPKQPVVSQG